MSKIIARVLATFGAITILTGPPPAYAQSALNATLEQRARAIIQAMGGTETMPAGSLSCQVPSSCGGDGGRPHHGVMYGYGCPELGYGPGTVCVSRDLDTTNAHRGSDLLHEAMHLYLFRLGSSNRRLVEANLYLDEYFTNCLAENQGSTQPDPYRCKSELRPAAQSLINRYSPYVTSGWPPPTSDPNPPPQPAPVVGGIAGVPSAPDGAAWIVKSDGDVVLVGNAPWFGSMAGQHLNHPMVGMTGTPSGDGYWLVASDGGIFAFGDAVFRGSTGGMPLNHPIVGMAATPSGGGYWLVASDGGIFAFGDAVFHGSTGNLTLNSPVVGIAATSTANGYWLVAADGGIFTFGDAVFRGSMGGFHLNQPIVGMIPTASGQGYWLVARDGGVFAFGDAGFLGSLVALNLEIVGITRLASGGYALVTTSGGAYFFGAPPTGPHPGCDDLNACTDETYEPVTGCRSTFAPRCLAPVMSLLLDSTCGDAVLDGGEDCDDGNIRSGDCCAPTCRFEPTGAPCGAGCDGRKCNEAGICPP